MLIVEDQLSIAQMIAAMVKDRWEYESVIAGSLRETKDAIKRNKFSVAISDLNLPDAPYGEIIDELAKAKIPTVAMTGAFGEELRDTMLKKGIIDYIPKENVHAYEYIVEIAGRICRNHHYEVLVVDDALSTRALLTHILENLQLKVFTANNGKEALEVLRRHPQIELALVDYEMPEMDGFTLIHEIRKKRNKEQLSIIGISASHVESISAKFLKAGANDFIAKPFTYEEILCRVGQSLEMLDLIHMNREIAYQDFLTKLYNRRYFFKSGNDLHASATRRKKPLVAVVIDIDHFKKINDTHGHDNGDFVLRHLADQLKTQLANHLVARMGGEEFAILLKDTSLDAARELIKNFSKSIKSCQVEADGVNIGYTISVGLTDRLCDCLDEQLKEADVNLYKAKNNGRDQVVG